MTKIHTNFLFVAADAGGEGQKQKISVTFEQFQVVTRILVMKLRESEESVPDGNFALQVLLRIFLSASRNRLPRLGTHHAIFSDAEMTAGMKQADLVTWYLENQSAKGLIADMSQAVEEWKRVNAIIQVMNENPFLR